MDALSNLIVYNAIVAHAAIIAERGYIAHAVRIDSLYEGDKPSIATFIVHTNQVSDIWKKAKLDGGITEMCWTHPPDYTFALPIKDARELDIDIHRSAYVLGAYDIERCEERPRRGVADHTFGKSMLADYTTMGTGSFGEKADEQTYKIAEEFGYIFWRFRPLGIMPDWKMYQRCKHKGLNKQLVDTTVDQNGRRDYLAITVPGFYREKIIADGHSNIMRLGEMGIIDTTKINGG